MAVLMLCVCVVIVVVDDDVVVARQSPQCVAAERKYTFLGVGLQMTCPF